MDFRHVAIPSYGGSWGICKCKNVKLGQICLYFIGFWYILVTVIENGTSYTKVSTNGTEILVKLARHPISYILHLATVLLGFAFSMLYL